MQENRDVPGFFYSPRGGIEIDSRGQISMADVFAAGDGM
jgi:NADPH-dependent 2,4-dienoyl-CoA reductase/sulfur reductase-like enzyme